MKKNIVVTYEINEYEKDIIDTLIIKVNDFINNKSTKSLEEMQAATSLVSSIFKDYDEEVKD